MPKRTVKEIQAAEDLFFNKVWYQRNAQSAHEEPQKSEIQLLKEEYGDEVVVELDDFHLGMINGKLSALRWVLGDEWDMLDT